MPYRAPFFFLTALILVLGAPLTASALPGDSLATERARLAHNPSLLPLKPVDGAPNRWSTHPRTGGDMTTGDDGWSVTIVTDGDHVVRESLDVKAAGKPYTITKDGAATFASVFGTTTAADLTAATIVATTHDDPQITTTFRRGKRFAYRTVDDQRNGLHTAEILALADLAKTMQQYNVITSASLNNPNVPTGEGAAIFAVSAEGGLDPIAVRMNGTFIPGSTDGTPSDKLRMESNASIATANNQVHVIFGGRIIATVPAKVANGAATITVPPSLHLNTNVGALASPTLGGHATFARRAPTKEERTAALAVAAHELGTNSASNLGVANLTALDLGHGPAIIGTVNLHGSGNPHTDKRLFFIAENVSGKLQATLANTQTIRVTEPLLDEVRETLVDAIDLGDGTLSVVTREIGYDAHTYSIYSRTPTGWKRIYSGGGAAL
ncbi:MAG: hypothetical protein JO225_00160 [Candidatus Eremiobacteraeota bacterium]|nr:hypothetical protein [Candidatus Eremiobacteraeota bacterium]